MLGEIKSISLYQIDGLIVPLVEPTVSLKIFISILLSFLIFFVFSWIESHLTTFQGEKKYNLQSPKSLHWLMFRLFFYLPHLSQSCVYMFLVSVLLINYISCTYSPALLLVCKSETWKMVWLALWGKYTSLLWRKAEPDKKLRIIKGARCAMGSIGSLS